MEYYKRKANTEVTEWQSKKLMALGIFSKDLDKVIDELRVLHRIVIYNTMQPYVDPTTKDGTILFRFTAIFLSKDGWNFRLKLGNSIQTPDIYVAKRQAIAWAIKYLRTKKK